MSECSKASHARLVLGRRMTHLRRCWLRDLALQGEPKREKIEVAVA